jgi:hypothetical protein
MKKISAFMENVWIQWYNDDNDLTFRRKYVR